MSTATALPRVFVFFSSMLALLMGSGVWLGYAQLLTLPFALAAVLLALVLSFFISKKAPELEISNKQLLLALAIPFTAALILFAVSFEDLTYPLTCTDFMTHANSIRIQAQQGGINWQELSLQDNPLPFSHRYPQLFFASGAQLYLLTDSLLTPYSIATLLSVLLTLFTGIGVFLAAMRVFKDYNTALFSVLIWQFSITTFFLIDTGSLTQLVGTFFLVSAFYLHHSPHRCAYVLSWVGLFSYPHLAVLMLFYIGLFALTRFDILNAIKDAFSVMGAVVLIFPELLGIFFELLTAEKFYTTVALLKGGTIFPNPLAGILPIFGGILLLWQGVTHAAKPPNFLKIPGKTLHILQHPVTLLLLAGLALELLLLTSILVNYVFHITPISNIYQLYMPAKLISALLFPIALIGGVGLAAFWGKGKIVTALIAILVVFHFAYFAGYSFTAISRNAFEPGYYTVAQYISTLPEGSTVSIDSSMLEVELWGSPQFPYQSLYDKPDPFTVNYCRRQQTGVDLAFPWAETAFLDEVPGREVVDSEGNQVVFIDFDKADYIFTDQTRTLPLVFKSGIYTLYDNREMAS